MVLDILHRAVIALFRSDHLGCPDLLMEMARRLHRRSNLLGRPAV
jgi:hypothetical protein